MIPRDDEVCMKACTCICLELGSGSVIVYDISVRICNSAKKGCETWSNRMKEYSELLLESLLVLCLYVLTSHSVANHFGGRFPDWWPRFFALQGPSVSVIYMYLSFQKAA